MCEQDSPTAIFRSETKDRAGVGDSPGTPSTDGATFFSYRLGSVALRGGARRSADRVPEPIAAFRPLRTLLGRLFGAIGLIAAHLFRS